MEQFRSRLHERQRGEAWYETATSLEAAMSGGLSLGLGEDVVKRIAENASGLSWGVLTRYLTTFRRLKAAAEAAGVPVEQLVSPGFNAVETAVRLYGRDPEAGLDVIKRLAERRIQLRDVNLAMANSLAESPARADKRSRSLRLRGFELQALDDALKRSVGVLFPDDAFIEKRPASRYFHTSGWEVRGADGLCLAGIDGLPSQAVAADDLVAFQTLAPKAALLSLYFPAYFMAISPRTAADFPDRAIRILDLFGLRWIGILRVTSELTIEVVRSPEGPPVPDRSKDYERLRAELMMSGTAA
jgi:hypothetical protein